MNNLRIGDLVRTPTGNIGEVSKFLDGDILVVYFKDDVGLDCFEYVESTEVSLLENDEDKIAFSRFGNTTIAKIIEDVPYDYAECAKALFFINTSSIDSDVDEDINMALFHTSMILSFINNNELDPSKVMFNKDAVAEYVRVAMAINNSLELQKAICIMMLFTDVFKLPKLIEILRDNFNEKA